MNLNESRRRKHASTGFFRSNGTDAGEEYPAFLQSYEKERYQALRVNPLKADRDAFEAAAPFTFRPVAWEPNGFYYEKEDAPGKHPYHAAGVYYIQEPSAMAPAAYLDAQPGRRSLICARRRAAKALRLQLRCVGKVF